MSSVLIVDDQPLFRRHLRRLLTQAGLAVVGEAGSIAEAEGVIEEQAPDLAVVDVMLPKVNGLEGARRLKTLAPDLRVILVSAHQDRVELFRTAAEEIGAEAFFAKDDLDLAVVRGWGDAGQVA
jgi:DNA-binding NarL/FixJ family response regulator